MHFNNWFKLASTLAIASTFLPCAISAESSAVAVEGGIQSSLDQNLMSTLGEVKGERHQFQSHVSRLLKIFANHMYTSDEAFLRELVSNSLDATRKAREVLLKKAGDSSTLTDAKQFKIVVQADSEKGLLSITDNGIGMTRKELQDFLGTIAKSGTAKFNLEKTKDSKELSDLIGQFGVGFYSVLLVADEVTVISKNDNDKDQWIWMWREMGKNDGVEEAASYSIAKDPRGATLGRGTQVIIKLKDESKRFLDENELETILKRFFEHDSNDIRLIKHEEQEVEDETAALEEKDTEDGKKENDEGVDVEEESTESTEKKEKVMKKITVEKEVLISQSKKPIWRRSPMEVSADDYNAFYKTLMKESSNPLGHIHVIAEGMSSVEFRSILFVPERPPFSPFTNNREKDLGSRIKLHVRGVFVTAKLEDFIPKHLGFVCGIIDSDDLPLNISRDILQNNGPLRSIQKKVVAKVFEMIENLSKDPVKFKKFNDAYGGHLKMEIIEDERYRAKLSKFLRYRTSKTKSDELISLQQYIENLPESVKKHKMIYYMAGSSYDEVNRSPFMERLREKDIEVLYLIDPVDEHTIQALREFDDFKFQNIAKDGLKLDADEEKAMEEELKTLGEEFKPLTEWIAKKALPKDVEKVVLSTRLTKSPCAIVASEWGWSGNMERVIMAQANSKDDPMLGLFAMQKKIFEINPKNEIIRELLSKVKSAEETKDESLLAELRTTVKALYDSTLIWSGYSVKNTKAFARSIQSLTRKVLGLEEDPNAAKEAEEDEKNSEKNPFDFSSMGNMMDDEDEDLSKENPAGTINLDLDSGEVDVDGKSDEKETADDDSKEGEAHDEL